MACAMIFSETYSIQAWFSGGLPCFLRNAATKAFDARGVDLVVPDRRPDPAEVAFARRPGVRRVEVEARDRVRQAEFGVLLDEVGDLVAAEVGRDEIGLLPAGS